jgi:hypothetical protein
MGKTENVYPGPGWMAELVFFVLRTAVNKEMTINKK